MDKSYWTKAWAPTAMQTQDRPRVAISSGRRSHLKGSRCAEGNSTWIGKAFLIVVSPKELRCQDLSLRFYKGDSLLTQTAECRRPDHLSCWGRSWSIVGVDQLIPLIGREQSYYWLVQRGAMGRLWIIQLVYQYHTTCTLHQKKTISTGFPKSKQLTLVGLQLPSVITFSATGDGWAEQLNQYSSNGAPTLVCMTGVPSTGFPVLTSETGHYIRRTQNVGLLVFIFHEAGGKRFENR